MAYVRVFFVIRGVSVHDGAWHFRVPQKEATGDGL